MPKIFCTMKILKTLIFALSAAVFFAAGAPAEELEIDGADLYLINVDAVSYTHLTLPTNREV